MNSSLYWYLLTKTSAVGEKGDLSFGAQGRLESTRLALVAYVSLLSALLSISR
jgi:hypothetical protein